MRLTPVEATWTPIIVQCIECKDHRTVTHGDALITMWADLDGVPYRAYYCADCAETLRKGGTDD